MEHHNLFAGFIRLHVLHHAAEHEIYGQWMIDELATHGYRLSPGTLYPMLHTMEQRGYLTSRVERTGRSTRKFYRATEFGLAGHEKNWPYATYELHELQESFDRVARYWPRYRNFAIAETIQAVTKEPMAALAEAIKSADTARFTKAYGELTDACNICQQSADRSMIVIQVPQASSFPDQNFRPTQR